MKQRMQIPGAVRAYSLAFMATGMVLAGALMVQQAKASLTLADSGIMLVSLSVSNARPYQAHDWGDKTDKNGRSVVFPPVQQHNTPGQSGQLNNPAPGTVLPLNRGTVYSEPLSCHPGCKLA